jgi:hypothetical protein
MARFRVKGKNHAGQQWRAAQAIVTFGRQIEELEPARHKSDGTVASAKHDKKSPGSDHRPSPRTGVGTVRAIDFGERGGHGFVDDIVEALRLSKDPRIKYVIHNGRKFQSHKTKNIKAWEWFPYTGENPHTDHGHLSVKAGDLGEQAHEFSVVSGQPIGEIGTNQEEADEEMQFTPNEEAFLKNFVKIVSEDMGSSRAFAASAIKDIRKDIITRNELIRFFSDLPTGSAEEAIDELLRRLNQ